MPAPTSFRLSLLASVTALVLAGCQTTSPTTGTPGVSYGDAKAVETVTTDLGSTDIQMISEKMTQGLIQTPEIQALIKKRQLLMASPVQNKTSEYFDTKLITDTILTQLQKNGVRYTIEADNMQNQVDELRRHQRADLVVLVFEELADLVGGLALHLGQKLFGLVLAHFLENVRRLVRRHLFEQVGGLVDRQTAEDLLLGVRLELFEDVRCLLVV